ncbi:MAG TPA: type II toxin-antitoxin system HicB family antitoxin [bacterium]|nr:type II toxin-antitoxin system HicB family antitoxin [bacterium]HPO09978.1 type II toxin-antitoxin system HicB family antitoxin [bacterium]HQO37118.1 type II toxin-antitoxin system HicB family antitoxin [bacterium]HQP97599.1 type II toxin-antitoxin system HicB family antitoxin [bacterium]
MKYHVIVEQDEDGIYVGRVPELRGCVSQGDSLEELLANMKEAIDLYLEVHPEYRDREEPNVFVGVETVEVS